MTISDMNAQYPMNAAEMRRAFDQVFAAPDRIRTTDSEDFLAIRVGTRPFALRVSELARIEVGRQLVGLPGGDSWLLGLANSQGKLAPVHSLELALGLDRTVGAKNWLAICGRDEPLGLAFDALEGYLRIARADIFSTGAADGARTHDEQAVRGGDGEPRPVVHLPSIVAAVRGRVSSAAAVGEA